MSNPAIESTPTWLEASEPHAFSVAYAVFEIAEKAV